MTPKVALSQDFLSNLATLQSSIQARVLKWALRFQSDPTANGINYETIKGARDRNLRSVRIDQDWRGIVFKPEKGDLYVLMYVDRHDDAYRWAERRRIAINPVTGAMQVFAVEALSESPIEESAPKSETRTAIYEGLTDSDLAAIGTPMDLVHRVREVTSEAELDALQKDLPVEVYEALFLIAAGDTLEEVLRARETRLGGTVDTHDFASAIETAESRARFVVVADPDTMTAILNSPLAQWRVFLHPTQRKLATSDQSGPTRVLGGAGTGKTVLAMHRAKWLAENRIADGQKLLFTTFTRNLAQDIEENLKSFCGRETIARIEVQNLDAWVHGFLRMQRYEYTIVFDRQKGLAHEAWELAFSLADRNLNLPEEFYLDELENVILAQGVGSRDEYRLARRAGRATVMTRAKRDAVWPVFEEYRTGLTLRKLKEVDDAYRDAAMLLREKEAPFASIIVDETQDFGPQALRLLRAMVKPGRNDLFFVGDGHQRIYSRHRASMSACGIDIRGRGRKLYLNYRTTEEIRRAAVALLEGCDVDDLDAGSDEVRRYKSLSRGQVPQMIAASSFEEAYAKAVQIAASGVAAGRSVCAMLPKKSQVQDFSKELSRSELEVKVIGPNARDQAESSAVRVATMHRAKGLEFDEVIIISRSIRVAPPDSKNDTRRLQYVAMTRAKRNASVIWVGP